MEIYEVSKSCVFNKVQEKWGAFSNMGNAFGVVVNGVRIKNTEALYQACRFPDYPEIQKEIIESHSGMSAKMISKKYRNEYTRKDWDIVKFDIMKYCVELKLYQNWGHLKPLLIESGDRPIVERSHKDKYWGTMFTDKSEQFVEGCNVLGNIWNEIKKDLDKYKTKPYHSIVNFNLYDKPIGDPLFANQELFEQFIQNDPYLKDYDLNRVPWDKIEYYNLTNEFIEIHFDKFSSNILHHDLSEKLKYQFRCKFYDKEQIDEIYNNRSLLEKNENTRNEWFDTHDDSLVFVF